MIKNYSFLTLCFIIICSLTQAQVPFAFRYQASIRDSDNKPINEELVFNINLFGDANEGNLVYSETHVALPDTNGLVSFAIGEGLTNNDFSEIIWGDGPYFVQVLIDNEEISYSQLVSVPYAMHAQTASSLHDLQEPVLSNDPTTKAYVDNKMDSNIDSISNLSELTLLASKAYADSLALTPKDLDVTSSGDTLTIGGTQLLIPGMSSDNMEKYESQVLLGGSYNENIISAQLTTDNNIILLGTTESSDGDVSNSKGDIDIWVVKLNQSLEILWETTLGGSAYDNPSLLLEETDGYLIAGTTESSDGDVSSNNGEFDLWLVKITNEGELTWESTYGGAATEFMNAVIPKDNGGYYVGATTYSNGQDVEWLNGECDVWILDIDTEHNITNSKTIGGSKYESLSGMQINADNELVLYISTSSDDGDMKDSQGELDYNVTTLNTSLEIQSQERYGSELNEQIVDHIETSKGELLIGNSFAEDWNPNASKQYKNIYLQMTGTYTWAKYLGGSKNDIIIDATVSNDTITLLGQSSSIDGDIEDCNGANDVWLMNIDTEGTVIKSNTIGGTYDESSKLIRSLPNGGWLIAAESESSDKDLVQNCGSKDIWVTYINKDLEIIWSQSFGGSYLEQVNDIIISSDNTIILCGTTASNDYSITGLHGQEDKNNDIWIIKTTIQ